MKRVGPGQRHQIDVLVLPDSPTGRRVDGERRHEDELAMRDVDQPLRQQEIIVHIAISSMHGHVFGGIDRAMNDGIERRRLPNGQIVDRHAPDKGDAAKRSVNRIAETAAGPRDQDVAGRPGSTRSGFALTSFINVHRFKRKAKRH